VRYCEDETIHKKSGNHHFNAWLCEILMVAMSQMISDRRDRSDHSHVKDRCDDGGIADRHELSDRLLFLDQCDLTDRL
jgi:hypothetical protein